VIVTVRVTVKRRRPAPSAAFAGALSVTVPFAIGSLNENERRSRDSVIANRAGDASPMRRNSLAAACADSEATERPTAVIITEILFIITNPNELI
jgi:hypothetical protein